MREEDTPSPHPLDYRQPQRAGRFARRTVRGFFITTAIVALLDMTILATLGATSDKATLAWQIVNFPSLPCVFTCVLLSPPPMGESEISPWDYMMVTVSFVSSCLIWGAMGAGIAKITARNPSL